VAEVACCKQETGFGKPGFKHQPMKYAIFFNEELKPSGTG
jgi:hypothetical protein